MSIRTYSTSHWMLGLVAASAAWMFALAYPSEPVRAETGTGGDTMVDAADSGTTVDTSTVDTGDATDATDVDALDATPADVGDTASDAAGAPDVDTGADADAGPDTGLDTAVDADTFDAGADVDTGPDADTGGDTGPRPEDTGVDVGPRFRFAGMVDVQFQTDGSGVEVLLRRTDADGRWERTTGPSGQFEIDGLAPGDYEVELSLSGYVTRAESLRLEGDREERYTLVRDQEAALTVEALFPEDADAPDTVGFSLEGERGSKSPSEPVSVEQRRASWSVDALPVGEWNVVADAEGWAPVSFAFTIAEPRASSTPFAVRLYMRRTPETPPAADTSGCTCRDRGGGGGGAPGPGGPFGPPAILVLFGLSVVGLRYASGN